MCLAVSTGQCYSARPEAAKHRVKSAPQYRLHPSVPPIIIGLATLSRTASLPYFGIDRIGDFGQVGAANLWKSGPLFSTGTKEAELMLEELRLNPRSPAARFRGRCPGESATTEDGTVDPRLSTGFAEGARSRSTGPAGAGPRPRRGASKGAGRSEGTPWPSGDRRRRVRLSKHHPH